MIHAALKEPFNPYHSGHPTLDRQSQKAKPNPASGHECCASFLRCRSFNSPATPTTRTIPIITPASMSIIDPPLVICGRGLKKYPAATARYSDVMATRTYMFSNGQPPSPCTGLADSSAEAGNTVPRVPAVAMRRANTSGTMILRIIHPFQVLTTLYTLDRLSSRGWRFSDSGHSRRPATRFLWTLGR